MPDAQGTNVSGVAREELDDDAYQVHEVFARFGLATYAAQVMERGIITLLTLASLERPWTSEQYDARWEKLARKTLGPLVAECERFLPHEAELLGQLRRALEARNRLAHNYFWDSAQAFTQPAGREEMLVDLLTFEEQFREVDAAVERVQARQAASLGFDLKAALGMELARQESQAAARWAD